MSKRKLSAPRPRDNRTQQALTAIARATDHLQALVVNIEALRSEAAELLDEAAELDKHLVAARGALARGES